MADFLKQLDEVVSKTTQAIQKEGKKALERLDEEKEKAKIRSEIGNTKKDLSKVYEQLGKDFFEAKEKGIELPDFSKALDVIRSKENVIKLLDEKLKTIGTAVEEVKDKMEE